MIVSNFEFCEIEDSIRKMNMISGGMQSAKSW